MPKPRPAPKKSFLRTQKSLSGDFSAQKTAKGANSPQSKKIFEGEEGDAVIYGRSKNYRGIFDQMGPPNEFWQRVTVLRDELRAATQKRDAAGLSGSGWTKAQETRRVEKAIRGDPPANNYFLAELATNLNFANTFLEAIGDPVFPERPKARARFLAESIAGYGEVGARTCRDICSEMRRKEKQRKNFHPELWIKCCGKARWTVNSVCPECGESPIPVAAFL
jgi:hypothetical protein